MDCCDGVQVAVERGHRECLERMRDEGKDIVGKVFVIGDEPASSLEQKDLCFADTVLLRDEPGHDDYTKWEYRTPIHSACAFGHLELAQWLVSEGASVDDEVFPGFGFTPLFCAVNYGRHDVVRWLLESGADPNACVASPDYANDLRDEVDKFCRSVHGASPLLVACQTGDLESVRILLEFGADPSVGLEHYRVLEALVDDVYFPRGPLAMALARRRVDIAEVLVRAGANVNSPYVFLSAVKCGLDAAKLVIENGLKLPLCDEDRDCKRGEFPSYELAEYFVENVANFTSSNDALLVLCRSITSIDSENYCRLLALLGRRGFDIDRPVVGLTRRRPVTFLSYAVRCRREDVVSCLLGMGASPNVCVEGVNLCVDAVVYICDISGRGRRPKIVHVATDVLIKLLYNLARHGLSKVPRPILYYKWWNELRPLELNADIHEDARRAFLEVIPALTTSDNGSPCSLLHLCRRVIVIRGLLSLDEWTSSSQWVRECIPRSMLIRE